MEYKSLFQKSWYNVSRFVQVWEMKVYWQGHEGKHVTGEKLQNPSQPLDYKPDSKIILNAYIQKI